MDKESIFSDRIEERSRIEQISRGSYTIFRGNLLKGVFYLQKKMNPYSIKICDEAEIILESGFEAAKGLIFGDMEKYRKYKHKTETLLAEFDDKYERKKKNIKGN